MNTKTHALDPSVQDIINGALRWRDWLTLGWYDFTIRHRRTMIGAFWETVQVGVWIICLSVVFGHHEGHGPDYFAYLAAGMISWNFITGTINSGASLFSKNANYMLNLQIPFSFYVFRSITESVAKLAFQAPVYIAVLAFFPHLLSLKMLMFLPGMLVLLFTAFWVAPLLGIIGSRFNDAAYLISIAMRLLFFISPVFWKAHAGRGGRDLMAAYNPFTYFLDVVRQPLLGTMPSAKAWTVALTVTLVGSLVTYLAFRRYRQAIIFWV